MGSSLSRQEELFLRRQWEALLEAAIAADTEAMEADASSGATAGPSTARTAKAGFSLSFREWQAFLAVLERRGAATEATSAPSDVCAKLTAAQLHVPVVALMVHLCAWWGGAITTEVLASRLDHLLQLVAGLRHGHEAPPVSAGEEGVSAGTPACRRARLARLVKQRVVHLGKARAAGNSNAAAAAPAMVPGDREQQQMQLDTFADMTVLAQHLLHQEGLQTGDSGDGADPIGTDAASLFEVYDEKIGNPDALKQRPVLAVVMVAILAVYACKVRGQSQLAVRSIAHLVALEQMMMTTMRATSSHSAPSGSGVKTSTGALAAAAASPPATSLDAMWPLMGALELTLVHRQHEADAQRSACGDGDALRAALRQMRVTRAALPRDEHASASRSPEERWAAGASQYVGQRPIWAALRSHFLSAGIFDADKPTVLVFFGPSGYGKSELARRVASVLHGVPMSELEGSGKLVYIHMPSFCTKDSIYSLVDPPAAHVGSGILLSALQKHLDAVVVLDEFEKSTAEAINNLWLSAFQKNGVLRSLKEASRSVSTVRTTFILTCNIAADSIAAREGLYLGAAPANQEKIRGLFEAQCRDVCRETMGEPFVNRVDAFFPFMPYTRAERQQFVCLLLERLLTSQADKGRHLYATPGFVDAMVDRLRTFHAATLEDAVRAQVLCMARAGWTTGVLTVERHVASGGASVPVLLPAHASELQSGTARAGTDDGESESRSLLVEAWESLPGGSTSLALWAESSAAAPAAVTSADTVPPLSAAASHVATPPPANAHVDAIVTAAASRAAPLTAPRSSTPAPPAELMKEFEYAVDTERITELEKELATTRELLRHRDCEIVTLKEKVLMLQKALALLLVSLLSCLCLMVFVIGLKLTLIFALAVVGCLVLVLGVPLSVLLDAVRGLFHLLGPYKVGGVAVLLLAWLARASRSAASSCP